MLPVRTTVNVAEYPPVFARRTAVVEPLGVTDTLKHVGGGGGVICVQGSWVPAAERGTNASAKRNAAPAEHSESEQPARARCSMSPRTATEGSRELSVESQGTWRAGCGRGVRVGRQEVRRRRFARIVPLSQIGRNNLKQLHVDL